MAYTEENALRDYENSETEYARAWEERERNNTYSGLDEEQIQKDLSVRALLEHEPKKKLLNNAEAFLAAQKERIEERGLAKVEGNKVRIGNEEVPVFDLNCMLADSLQKLYAGEDPKAEYYDWVNSQRTIEADYHVNGVSDEELSAGRGFAAFLDDRETEMKLVMSLYMSAAIHGKGYYKERAQEQLYFMRFKLRELRRIRTAIQEANRSAQLQNQAEKEREEQRLQKQAEHAAYMMIRAGVYAYELEGRFAERVDAIRPGAINAGDARERLAQIRERRLNIRDLISKGYRMGKSKEALEAEHSEKTSDKDLYAEHLRERGRQIRGFREDEYLRLNGRQRSYA